MKLVAFFEFAMAAVLAYVGIVQLRIAPDMASFGMNPIAGYIMAGGALVASLLLVLLGIRVLQTNMINRRAHALPFILLALTASAFLIVGRAA